MYIGKYVNTHGIKGEIKIQSDIDHKMLFLKLVMRLVLLLKLLK